MSHAEPVLRRRRGRGGPGRAGRLLACFGAAVPLALLLTALAAAPAAAAAHPAARSAARATLTLAAPDNDYSTRLRFDVATINPTLVTSTGPATLTVTGTLTNTGPEELVDLSYRVQRGEALRSTAAVHDEIADPSEPTAQVPSTFTSMTGSLPAGQSAPFTFTTSIVGADGLNVGRPGVYPVMVNVNGGVMLDAGPLEARIGELHLLLTVIGVPGTSTTGQPASGTPTPFNFVWPMVDVPHLGVDGVFLNDDLLTSISPGGRLATLLDGLTTDATPALPSGALTVVIDPQLLDELDRMTQGYRVVDPAGAAQPSVTAIDQAQTSAPSGTAGATGPTTETGTPTGSAASANGSADVPGTVAGTGQQAAASFLERLRAVAATHPVVLLPYGDPDVVALVRAGLSADVAAATEHGREVARRVWGDLGAVTAPSATSTAYPIDGATDDATLSTLIAAGATAGLLSQASVTVPADASGQPTSSAVIEPEAGGTGLPSVIAQTDVLGGLDKLIDDKQQAGWATKVNSLTALLAQQRSDGAVTPAVFAPTRRWSPDSEALAGLVQLLGEFGRSGVITGETLDSLEAAATTVGTATGRTDYPDAARDRELPADYLQRVTADRAAVAGLRTELTSIPQHVDPATVLDPLDAALDTAASTAFRTDPTVGEANLDTVESTVSDIRSGVQIATSSTNYTLASSTSPLVLTVQNSTAYDVPITVQLTGGEMVGLTTTDQPVQIIPAGRSQQVKIPTQVTRSGQFQVTATLIGPDGNEWGTPVQLTVQSSAYGTLTVVLIAVAGGVLVIMVALRIRQRLRARRARIAAAAGPPAEPRDPAPSATAVPPAPSSRPTTRPVSRSSARPGEPGPAPDRRLVPGSPRSADADQQRQDFSS